MVANVKMNKVYVLLKVDEERVDAIYASASRHDTESIKFDLASCDGWCLGNDLRIVEVPYDTIDVLSGIVEEERRKEEESEEYEES